jgi:hypothetical protein
MNGMITNVSLVVTVPVGAWLMDVSREMSPVRVVWASGKMICADPVVVNSRGGVGGRSAVSRWGAIAARML